MKKSRPPIPRFISHGVSLTPPGKWSGSKFWGLNPIFYCLMLLPLFAVWRGANNMEAIFFLCIALGVYCFHDEKKYVIIVQKKKGVKK